MNTNGHEYRWSSFGGTTSEAHPGARASRPHNSWHSLVHLLHLARPAAAPGLCFGRAHAVLAGRVAGCRNAGKLSGAQRECMRAGRPRSRVGPSGWCGGGTIRPATSPKADDPFGKLPFARVPAPRCLQKKILCILIDVNHPWYPSFTPLPTLGASLLSRLHPLGGPPLPRRRHGKRPTWERGRPARTIIGTASAISSTWLDRQRRRDSASAEPMPYPPAGWPGAASQGN